MFKLLFIILLLMGCENSNPIATEQEIRLMEQHTTMPGELPQPMIVGGEEVNPACPNCKYEFMVSLQSTGGWGGHFCGGSLVREDWVVTAAHCVIGDSPSGIQVKIGLHNVNGTSGAITRNVSEIIIHPSYSNNSLNNDYALLRLSSPVTNFEPIQLITENQNDDEPVIATTMGWGATYSGGWGSSILLEVDVPIDESCGNIGNQVTNHMVCAGDNNGGEDSCQGDSGGPLIMTNSDGEYELIGIVSWGYGCGDAGYPGVYSRIWTRKDWFFGYIGEPEEDFQVELYGDVNFDGTLNILDVVTIVGFVLNNPAPTEEELLTGDMNQDGILNILDVISLVGEVIGLSFGQSVDWLRINFPKLEVDKRLGELNKSIHFSK